MSPSVVSVMDSSTDADCFDDASLYQSLIIGSLLYLMIATRPDIGEAVSRLCRHMAAPTPTHWKAAKRVLAYVKASSRLGITFTRGEGELKLHGYADADWTGDKTNRKSTKGYVFMMNDACVSWKSQLQKSVALSTAEAEYMALAAASQEALFLRQLLNELGKRLEEPTCIGEDNQSCIAMATNQMTTSRAKHIDISGSTLFGN